jgi:uncharacterized protein
LKFSCLESCGGKCCKVAMTGKPGFVFLTKDDRQRILSAGLKLIDFAALGEFAYTRFTRKRTKQWFLKTIPSGDCRFLVNGKCSVYEARPTQCRTFPFWPELMNFDNKTPIKNLEMFCPGVGIGDDIVSDKLTEQIRADFELCQN